MYTYNAPVDGRHRLSGRDVRSRWCTPSFLHRYHTVTGRMDSRSCPAYTTSESYHRTTIEYVRHDGCRRDDRENMTLQKISPHCGNNNKSVHAHACGHAKAQVGMRLNIKRMLQASTETKISNRNKQKH